MVKKVVDTLLPTTMVGSYPRPHWFKHQLLGRDVRVAFKEVQHEEAYNDAVATVIRDQEEAGLDIVTDGNMWYDDYVGVIGSFCWYMYERIGGFEPAREPHPSHRRRRRRAQGKAIMDDWGGVINSGPVTRGPIRLADLYKIAAKHAKVPVKVSVGAGPANLAWHAYFKHYKDAKELSYRAGAHLQRGDEGPRRRRREVSAVRRPRRVAAALHRRQGRLQVDPRRRRAVLRRREREDRLALLLRQRLGQRHSQRALPRGLSDGAAALLRHRRASTSSCSTTPTATWPASSS